MSVNQAIDWSDLIFICPW